MGSGENWGKGAVFSDNETWGAFGSEGILAARVFAPFFTEGFGGAFFTGVFFKTFFTAEGFSGLREAFFGLALFFGFKESPEFFGVMKGFRRS